MKKKLFYFPIFLFCLALTTTGCSEKEGDFDDDGYNFSTIHNDGIIPAEGGTVNAAWSRGIAIYDNVYTSPWEYGIDNTPQPTATNEDSWEKVDVTIEQDILTGDGIVIAPVGSKVDGRYPGVIISISPNTTGKKRCFRIFDSVMEFGEYIFQDCTEPEEE